MGQTKAGWIACEFTAGRLTQTHRNSREIRCPRPPVTRVAITDNDLPVARMPKRSLWGVIADVAIGLAALAGRTLGVRGV